MQMAELIKVCLCQSKTDFMFRVLYSGQWLRGMRHGYGTRTSAQYGHSTITKLANNQTNLTKNSSLQSLDTEGEDPEMHQAEHRDGVRGGFVLVTRVNPNQVNSKRRNSLVEKTASTTSLTGGLFKGLRLRKQRSTGDLDFRSSRNQKSMTPSLRSSREGSETSTGSRGELSGSKQEMGSNASFLTQNGDISDPNTVETYSGEWKNDKRCGFGICERTDGLRYEGEWFNNKKNGYGVTTFPDGTREEGKYKNNQLVTNLRKKHLFMMRSSKLKERIESAIVAAARSQQIALQKSDIGASRTATARAKAEQADYAASTAQNDSQMAFIIAKQHGGADFHGQGSIAPLRRRLSDFSQVKRHGQLMNSMEEDHSGQSQNRQFLDPNEPFGGRRGSFRNQMLAQNNTNMNKNSNQMAAQHNPNSYNPMHHPPMNNANYGYQMANQQNNRFLMTPQTAGVNQQHPLSKDPFSQAFTDHFDHYQLAMMNQRNRQGTPTSTNYPSNSYGPSPSQMASSSSQLSFAPSMTPSPSASPFPPSVPFNNNGLASPYPMSNSRPQLPSSVVVQPSSSSIRQIPPMKPKNRMNANSSNIEYSVDESHDSFNENPGSSDQVRHLRTSSLYRPTVPSTGNQSSGPSTSGKAFKRKPSLQTNVAKQVNKQIMSREEASVLSHQQREHRRVEQEYQERLSRNPLLYLWSPTAIAWLNRQKLVILVFLINISIAYLFVRMIL